MLWIIIAALAGFGIGIAVGVFIMWEYRNKYLVCNTERRSTELMLSQKTPRRGPNGKFVKAAA